MPPLDEEAKVFKAFNFYEFNFNLIDSRCRQKPYAYMMDFVI